MQPLLTFLIPSTPDRKEETERLVFEITRQCGYSFVKEDKQKYNCDILHIQFENKPVELYVFTDNKKLTIGEKRELMYGESKGLYSVQWDSDDWMHQEAVDLILGSIITNPQIDCITYREKCFMNGQYKTSNHSLQYNQWLDNHDSYDFTRTPFYKDVIKTKIARSVPFPNIRWNEDEQWSKVLYSLLTSEIHIDEEIYHYIYEPKDSHEQRYGINQ